MRSASPVDRFLNQAARIFCPHPVANTDPFAGFKILVMLKKMFDLRERNLWQIGIFADAIISSGELRDRNGKDFFVLA